MIYIIISNIGLALITILMYIRYSHFRISSSLKIRDLEKSLKSEIETKNRIEEKLNSDLKKEIEQVKSLLRELEESRKERQEEIRLRLEAEKQIDLANQKIEDVKVRIKDWETIQLATLKDSKQAIVDVGSDLFERISQNNIKESKQNQELVDSALKAVNKQLLDIIGDMNILKKRSQTISTSSIVSGSALDNKNSASLQVANIVIDDIAKKSVTEVVSLIKVSGLTAQKDYLVSFELDEQRAKFMLCELAIIKEKELYLIDFKSCKYFKEYDLAKDKQVANEIFKSKIEKYINYISNPKYKISITKVIDSYKMSYSNIKLILAVRNRDDLKLLKDTKFVDNLNQLNIQLFDVNMVNDLVL